MKKVLPFLLTFFFTSGLLRAQVIDAGGGGGAYTIATYPGNFTGYYNGFSVVFRANHNCPANPSMTINGVGPISIVNTAGGFLAAGDIKTNQVVTIVYDVPGGNVFQMVTTSGNVSAGGGVSGSGTASRVALFATANSLGNSSIYESAANIGVGAAPGGTYKFEVNGRIGSAGILETSDQRYKKNIVGIENALQKVMLMRGVNYDWRADEFKEKNFPLTPQIGLIAQEVEKIIPQVVTTDAAGFKSVEYSKLVALLIEAIKEQNKKIDTLIAENKVLKTSGEKEMQTLKSDVKSLHDAIDILLKENVSLKTGQK